MIFFLKLASNILALKSTVVDEINYIVNFLKSEVANGKQWFVNCLNDAKDGAVDLAKEITDNLNKCIK